MIRVAAVFVRVAHGTKALAWRSGPAGAVFATGGTGIAGFVMEVAVFVQDAVIVLLFEGEP